MCIQKKLDYFYNKKRDDLFKFFIDINDEFVKHNYKKEKYILIDRLYEFMRQIYKNYQ